MKTMVDADEYVELRAEVAKLSSAVWLMALAMGRLDLLQEAGFDIRFSNGTPVTTEEERGDNG